MSEHLNVGDVTGPRWAGGTRSPEKDPWEGFTGQSQADADDALITDPLIKRIQELRAEVGVLREQLAAAEARAVHAELEWAEADARTVLAVAAKADAWDEGARYVTHDSTYTEMFDIPKNPYRRTGDTNA